jgi:uncharacterized protein YoaH (UPF0181 family)
VAEGENMRKMKIKAAAKKGAVKTRKSGGARKMKIKPAAKIGVKKSRRKGYNPQTGQLTGRAVEAQERLEKYAERLMAAEGLSSPEARERARQEMRNNTTGDWRKGKR